MHTRTQRLLWIAAVAALWAATILGAAKHIDDNAQITIAAAAVATSVVAAVYQLATGNRREISRTAEEVTRLRDYTEVSAILGGAGDGYTRSARTPGGLIRVHRVVIDNEPMVVATTEQTTLNTRGVRRGLGGAHR